MFAKLRLAQDLINHLGWDWVRFRAKYAVQQKLGVMQRRMPASSWSDYPLSKILSNHSLADVNKLAVHRREEMPAFFFAPDDLKTYQPYFSRWDENQESNPITTAKKMREGKFSLFSRPTQTVGLPPDWHKNQISQERATTERHWSALSDFEFGDIKAIWELSRFGFVFTLVRAYWRTEDGAYPTLFWQLFEDWMSQNPPNQGVNWKCGQETSLRVMALCFGLYGFGNSTTTTPERIALFYQLMTVSGSRIEGNLEYAISQRNNHAVSEGMGLFTIGCLFPELKKAKQWRQLGRQVLEDLGQELIYADGSFSQHSFNYQRLMLHDYAWSLQLGKLHGESFSKDLQARVLKSAQLLFQLQDADSGRVPNYGQNDGALILPLSNNDYHDFRPVIQAVHTICAGERVYAGGELDEALLWLGGIEALSAPLVMLERDDLKAKDGGYFTIRANDSFAFIRCAAFKDRPAQADMLHVDLWWRGENVTIDAGTFSYNAPVPWNNALTQTEIHNTVNVDDKDQMERRSKFLWLPWLTGRTTCFQKSQQGNITYWQGEHDGYMRLSDPVLHRRGIVRAGDDIWIVLDHLTGLQPHDFCLHWLLPDWDYHWVQSEDKLELNTNAGTICLKMISLGRKGVSSLRCGDMNSKRGWRAERYQQKMPALSVDFKTHDTTAHFVTLLTPEIVDLTINNTSIEMKTTTDEVTLSYVPLLSGANLVHQIEMKRISEPFTQDILCLN